MVRANKNEVDMNPHLPVKVLVGEGEGNIHYPHQVSHEDVQVKCGGNAKARGGTHLALREVRSDMDATRSKTPMVS